MFNGDIKDNRDVMINKLTNERQLRTNIDELEYLFTETGVVPCIYNFRWPEKKWEFQSLF